MCEYQAIYTVSGMLQAMNIRSGLEKAGIPSRVAPSKNQTGLVILVPAGRVFDARNLLFPSPRVAEILVARSE